MGMKYQSKPCVDLVSKLSSVIAGGDKEKYLKAYVLYSGMCAHVNGQGLCNSNKLCDCIIKQELKHVNKYVAK